MIKGKLRSKVTLNSFAEKKERKSSLTELNPLTLGVKVKRLNQWAISASIVSGLFYTLYMYKHSLKYHTIKLNNKKRTLPNYLCH